MTEQECIYFLFLSSKLRAYFVLGVFSYLFIYFWYGQIALFGTHMLKCREA